MKKVTFLLIFSALISLSHASQAKELWAYLTYATFFSPTEGPYVETYISVAARSVEFVKNDNGKFQATVNLNLMFKQNNEVKSFKKYDLFSPEVTDTTKLDFNFLDLQRFAIPNGTYDLDIIIADKHGKEKPFETTQPITLDFPEDKITLSGIELVYSYEKSTNPSILTKSGYDLVPNVYNFYPSNTDKLAFFTEIYNTEKIMGTDQKFLLTYYIESFENNRKLDEFTRVRKEIARPINILLSEFNISNLPTGNYNLGVEIRNQRNELVASNQFFFQRSNPKASMNVSEIAGINTANTFVDPIRNRDTLVEYVNSVYPITTATEKNFIQGIIKTADVTTLQQFFFSFWSKRNPANPESAWREYQKELFKVDALFKTSISRGYQTDRGRVYLQYGPPNTRVEEKDDPATYPYEIWHYYTLRNQTNRKFVFFARDRSTNDYVLIHSDAIGEVQNYRWQVDLRNRVYAPVDLQNNDIYNIWGSRVKDYFDNPY